MHSVDLRQLLSLRVSHIYHSNVGGKSGILRSTFQKREGQLASEFKAEMGNQVLVAMTPLQIECLASKLVFGTKGLVLWSSMALIPTETSSIFLEGKIHIMNF